MAAALPVIYGAERTEVVLVNARSSRRYIPTKGAAKLGESLRDCAGREALEEAGVIGLVSEEPVAFLKQSPRGKPVPMFLLSVEQLLDDWAERKTRDRLIVSPARAVLMIDDPDLISVLMRLFIHE
jgi:ADP-ribose pyrophosphatase YjhB (NUDIX family)